MSHDDIGHVRLQAQLVLSNLFQMVIRHANPARGGIQYQSRHPSRTRDAKQGADMRLNHGCKSPAMLSLPPRSIPPHIHLRPGD